MRKFNLLATGLLSVTAFTYHCNEIYKREKEIFDRVNFCLENKEKLSGVYLMQRQPLPQKNVILNAITWLLPYHQSLKIVDKEDLTKSRQIGLSIVDVDDNDLSNLPLYKRLLHKHLSSEFVLHVGGFYDEVNGLDFSIPIECWYDYKAKFGHYPSINVNELNKLTITKSELGSDNDLQVHQAIFGLPKVDSSGSFVFTTCRSEVMSLVRKAELNSTN
jgi:hypothetical protein